MGQKREVDSKCLHSHTVHKKNRYPENRTRVFCFFRGKLTFPEWLDKYVTSGACSLTAACEAAYRPACIPCVHSGASVYAICASLCQGEKLGPGSGAAPANRPSDEGKRLRSELSHSGLQGFEIKSRRKRGKDVLIKHGQKHKTAPCINA